MDKKISLDILTQTYNTFVVIQIFIQHFYCSDLFITLLKRKTIMDISLMRRIQELQRLKEKFGLDQQRIADASIPKKNRATVALVLKGEDERYITESNVEAIEKGIEAILTQYRQELCK